MLARQVVFVGVVLFHTTPMFATGEMYVAQPTRIVRLVDRNGDGDFLDTLESEVFAEGLENVGRIVAQPGDVWAIASLPSTIVRLRDLNGDGDALDVGEALSYASLPVPQSGVMPVATAICRSFATVFLVADEGNGALIRIQDHNGDDDALDTGEAIVVAQNIVAPRGIAMRSDGIVLVAQNNAAVPIRILQDRNADGDFFDFAENLSYVEGGGAVADVGLASDALSYGSRTATNSIFRFLDRNGDDDALDTNESLVFAEPVMAPTVIAYDAVGQTLFAATGVDSIVRIVDVNGDDDALDVGEMLVVATSLPQISGMAVVSDSTACTSGDADGNGRVEPDDVAIFVSSMLGFGPTPACSIDMNSDGALDGRDVQLFVDRILDS